GRQRPDGRLHPGGRVADKVMGPGLTRRPSSPRIPDYSPTRLCVNSIALKEPGALMNLARFCERCKRLTTDGNLWCQDRDCPAEQGYPVFAYGDTLGDLKIIKLVTVCRTGALYEYLRGQQTVWLKVD